MGIGLMFLLGCADLDYPYWSISPIHLLPGIFVTAIIRVISISCDEKAASVDATIALFTFGLQIPTIVQLLNYDVYSVAIAAIIAIFCLIEEICLLTKYCKRNQHADEDTEPLPANEELQPGGPEVHEPQSMDIADNIN